MVLQKTRAALDANALEKYVHAHLGAHHGAISELSQFDHGQSNPTYYVRFGGSNAQWVLRKKPHGPILPSAHAVEREYRVLQALHFTNVPVPKPILLCEDTTVLGTAFYLMQHVQGRIFMDTTLRDVKPLHRYAIYSAALDALVKLHSVDYKKVGLQGFGKPEKYCSRVVQRWSKQIASSEPALQKTGVSPSPKLQRLQKWLEAHVDEAEAETKGRTSIVHGDFRLDNLVFHPTEPRVLAILDWELCTIGNPMADVATFAFTYRIPNENSGLKAMLPGLDGAPLQKLGIPDEREWLRGYCRRSRCLQLSQTSWNAFMGMVVYRYAGILHGVYARSLQGNASSAHAADSAKAMEIVLDLSDRIVTPPSSSMSSSDLTMVLPFPIRPHAQRLYDEVKAFCEEKVYPAEYLHLEQIQRARDNGHVWKLVPSITEELKKEAKKKGLWNMFLPPVDIPSEDGSPARRYGCDLTNLEYGLICELTGRSIMFAPEVFNCAAPDTGNMEILSRFGTPEQKRQWLEPLLKGTIRSCFAMTEPDVASSDASNIETLIERDEVRKEYVINGVKFYISGAGDPRCKLMVVMGKTNPRGKPFAQQSMILVPMDTPGVSIDRPMGVFGYDDAPHGHMQITLKDVRVPFSSVLLGEGRGFEIAQARLGPGRIHHCMRTIGAAERCLDLMVHRAKTRTAFGQQLAENALVASQIAESRCEIDSARLLTLQAAHAMDMTGNKKAAQKIAMIKIVAPNMALKVVDRAIQIHGGAGVGQDTVLPYFFAQLRTLRIADGPDEVHMRTIAKHELGPAKL